MLSTFLISTIFIAAGCGGGTNSNSNTARQQAANTSSASTPPPASQTGLSQSPTPSPAANVVGDENSMAAASSPKPGGGESKPLPKEVSELAKRIRELEQKGRDMETFRSGKNEAGLRKCNDSMVVNSIALESFKRALIASNMPAATTAGVNYKEQLFEATGYLNNCLSCTPGAVKFCDQTRFSLNQLEK